MNPLLDTYLLYAVLAGAAFGGGLLLLIVGIRGKEIPPSGIPPKKELSLVEALRLAGERGAIAAIAGGVVLLVTGWPVAAVAVAVLVLFGGTLFGGAAGERLAVQRIEGLANWTESLRDTIAGAVGLEQAIPASVRAASPAIQPHLRLLADRLRTRMALPAALQRFAEELDDASADLIIAALILNSRLRGPGLRDVLGALAQSAREEVAMRQRVEAQRKSTRQSVRIVVGVSLLAAALLVVLNRDYLEPYETVTGQIVLLIVIGFYALGFMWLKRLSRIETPSRFLGEPAARPTGPTTPDGGPVRGDGARERGRDGRRRRGTPVGGAS